MPIIVEGPDGAGKTTLIANIVRMFDIHVMPRVVSKETKALVDLVSWVDEDNGRPTSEAVLYDRHRLISELIYGPLIRAHTEPHFDELVWLFSQQRLFYMRKPLVIYCLPPKFVVMQNVRKGEDNQVPLRSIRQIYDSYVARAALDSVHYPEGTYIHDYTTIGSTAAILQAVAAYLKRS